MGIFKRVKTIAVADMNHKLDKYEDPISMVKQYIRELETELEKAQSAIHDRMEQEKKLQAFEQQLTSIKNQTTQLKAQVVKLKDTYAELQNRKALLISRANAAKTTYSIKSTLHSSQSENILNGFARMEDKVLHLEAQASAQDYLYEKDHLNEKTYSVEVEEEFIKAKEAISHKHD
jgi:phage shock protein A